MSSRATSPEPEPVELEADVAADHDHVLSVGDRVRVKRSVTTPRFGWGDLDHSFVGTILKRELDDGEDSCFLLIPGFDGPRDDNTWQGHCDDLELAPETEAERTSRLAGPLMVGDLVRVKACITEPKYKWGNRDQVCGVNGRLIQIDDDGDVIITFPERVSWRGLLSEIERVPVDGEPVPVPVVVSVAEPEAEPTPAPARPLEVGDQVRVKACIREPVHGWGDRDEVCGRTGTLRRVDGDSVYIDFPEFSSPNNGGYWRGMLNEIERAEPEVPAPMPETPAPTPAPAPAAEELASAPAPAVEEPAPEPETQAVNPEIAAVVTNTQKLAEWSNPAHQLISKMYRWVRAPFEVKDHAKVQLTFPAAADTLPAARRVQERTGRLQREEMVRVKGTVWEPDTNWGTL